jgi:hypothetical protein
VFRAEIYTEAMSQELTVDGKTYVTSKQAAVTSGYAQDYIGQLARKQLIDARRIGGLWYVHMESLEEYQKQAEAFKPQPPAYQPEGNSAPESVISFDGRDYVSAAKAAALTGYHQDYVGQLARGGAVLSRQIGNRWYVDREGILAHKNDKDALLAAVQAESVGIAKQPVDAPMSSPIAVRDEAFTYFNDTNDLLPHTSHKEAEFAMPEAEELRVENKPHYTPVPIRKVSTISSGQRNEAQRTPIRRHTVPLALIAGALATIVIVLSVGYTSLKSGATYTMAEKVRNTAASLASLQGVAALQVIADLIEQQLPTLDYKRK